jgi:hypothetical protein
VREVAIGTARKRFRPVGGQLHWRRPGGAGPASGATMPLAPDLIDPTLAPLGLRHGLYFPRSQQVLALTPEQRWEVTRRHPYYLKCWTRARSYHQHMLADPKPEPKGDGWALAEACAGVVRGLGVRIDNADFPDPALDWNDPRHPWGGVGYGAVVPMTPRELVLQLLARLPDAVRKAVGAALQEDSALRASFAVNRLRDDPLDQPQADMVMYWPGSSLKAITEELTPLVKGAKGKQARRRPEEFKEQLRVWDLREGWTGSGYDGKRERALRDIAKETGADLSGVKHNYGRAFAHIVGRPFSTELWVSLFLPLKAEESLRKTWRTLCRRKMGRAGPPTSLNQRAVQTATVLDGDWLFAEFTTRLVELSAQGMAAEAIVGRAAADFEIPVEVGSKDWRRLAKFIKKTLDEVNDRTR